jgi:pyruvate dehydrogenase E2 component (dihydrolipoamide acetyltransferase)
MAERTTQSWTTVPHFFVVREVDAGALNEARQKLGLSTEQSHQVKLTHTDLLVRWLRAFSRSIRASTRAGPATASAKMPKSTSGSRWQWKMA